MRQLDPNIENALDSLVRTPQAMVRAENWLPRWTRYAETDGYQVGMDNRALGHTAILIADDPNPANHRLLRFKVGQNDYAAAHYLSWAVIPQSMWGDPSAWDSQWDYLREVEHRHVMHSAFLVSPDYLYSPDSLRYYGTGMSAVHDAANNQVQVFFGHHETDTEDTWVWRYIFSDEGVYISHDMVVDLPTTRESLSAMQMATVAPDEVFLTRYEQVEPGYAAWHKPVYGTTIHRYYYDDGWQLDDAFDDQWHTHLYGGVIKDAPDYDAAIEDIFTQWGFSASGGLAANVIDDDTVAISFGGTWYRRHGYETHSQAVWTFHYHRQSGLWELVNEASTSDYKEEEGLAYDLLCKGSSPGGTNVLVWSRFVEPTDYAQTTTTVSVPRLYETVFARFSDDGRHLTQFQYLGDPRWYTGATLLEIEIDSESKLVALGWRAFAIADMPAILKPGQNQEEGTAVIAFETSQSNRWQTQLQALFGDPTGIIDEGATHFAQGNLLRLYLTYGGVEVQLAQGLIDTITPSIQSDPGFDHGAQVIARADKALQDTRSEAVIDIGPQETLHIRPYYPVKYMARHKGHWRWQRMSWPNVFFPGEYPELEQKGAYRLGSSPEAVTGGDLTDPDDPTSGGGGAIWTDKRDKVGTWWNDVSWVAMTPMVDGCIEATVRFGNDINYGNFDFIATTGHRVFATLNRYDGILKGIDWRTDSYAGPIWNPKPHIDGGVRQDAIMAGVICHAVEIGKKYAFVWECNSDFDLSSHTDDTWTSENFDKVDFAGYPVGANRLYLVMSDYDESDEDWAANDKWIHRVVAGGIEATGLTPGRPAQLRLLVSGGTIYCYYRPYSADPLNQEAWRLAIVYKSGRFGAGRYGIIGRGGSGIQWDYLYPGRHHINQTDNVVDFWGIEVSNTVRDKTMEDVLHYLAWTGMTPTRYRTILDEAGAITVSGVWNMVTEPAQATGITPYCVNPVIDFDAAIADGEEVGVILRAINVGDPDASCVVLWIENGAAATFGATGGMNVRFEQYSNGAVVYSDTRPVQVPLPDYPAKFPVRVSARGDIYTVWIAGKYVGHFRDVVELGGYIGFATSNDLSANIYDPRIPELYEVPEYSYADVNETMQAAMQRVIGKRRIKAFYDADGNLYISYFLKPEEGPGYEHTLIQSDHTRSDRFVSVQMVQGACAEAMYANTTLLARGRRFASIVIEDIEFAEFCYLEAKAIVKEVWERQKTVTFIGLPDLRSEPEDVSVITVTQQGLVTARYLVDDRSISFNAGSPDGQGVNLSMQLSARQQIQDDELNYDTQEPGA